MASVSASSSVTFLFTDIEGSTRLWEQEPGRMPLALARHDELARAAVESNRGAVVKMVGDGLHAVFDEPLDAFNATVAMQEALIDVCATNGVALQVRCGLHTGPVERRDNDYFGSTLNRAARIMAAAHGGQVLLSQAVAALVVDHLPAGVALRDLGSVRLRDLASPERVYQVVHPRLRQEFPALRSLESTPNNLPQHVSSFIGRERELAEVKKLLGNIRLLTLLGVGGIGKTRLSLQVAADVMDDYPDGVWLVELAPIVDSRLVSQAVASVLGVREEAGRPVFEALLKHVKDRQLLIILDNCEHLLQACAGMAKQLLQSGPHVKVLASSREHLHLAGEASYSVPSLAMSHPLTRVTLASLTQYEAARLFVDRAAAAQPAFHVTDQNAAAISDICHRLDGIPLAIELAAARVRALSVEQIAAHLNDRFRLLTGGDRTALPRQQTLRALIDWSYDLLTDHERVLFRRLAVFAGGWTLEAARMVCAGDEIDEADVIDLLTHLVEKSLVALEAGGERYRLLQTIRQYAQELIDKSGEESNVRTRHLAHYLVLAEEAELNLTGPEQGAWLLRLTVEQDNFLSAHAWCNRAQDGAELGLRLVSALRLYWPRRGLLEMGYHVTGEALTRSGANSGAPARCKALGVASAISFYMGRYEEARGYVETSLAIAREIGDRSRVAGLLMQFGNVSSAQGDFATARSHLEESLSQLRELGDKRRLPAALNALAELHYATGDLKEAEPLYEEALARCREQGDRSNTAVGLLCLTMVSIGRGSMDLARVMMLEALAIIDEVGSKRSGRYALGVSAGLAAFLGDWERAARFYGAGEAQGEQMALHAAPSDEAFLAPLIARTRGAIGATTFAKAEAAGRALSYENAVEEARAWLETAR